MYYKPEEIEHLTAAQIAQLPTLDEVFESILQEENQVIEGYKQGRGFLGQPFPSFKLEFNNAEPSDVFFVNRLRSRDPLRPIRYSLKPNLMNRAFVFRGQSLCKNPSTTSALRKSGRYVSENVRYVEFCRAIQEHPLIKLMLDGFDLCGEHYFFEVNFQGLAQHYELKTFVMDMTSDVEAAKFFACTEYKDGIYKPVLDESRYGMVYYYDSLLSPLAFQTDPNGNQLSTIGLQVFPRSGCQKGFLYLLRKDDNFNKCLGVKYKLFRHSSAISDRCYKQANEGLLYFPKDELSSLAERIRKATVLPTETFMENLRDNPDDSLEENIRLCGEEGLCFSPDADHIVFNEEEKRLFRNRIQEGFWDDFCSKIVFPKHHDRMIKELRDLPNKEEYAKYYEW